MLGAVLSDSFTLNPVTPADSHHFYGYYDKSPWNADDQQLLAHSSPFVDRRPDVGDRAGICLFDTETGERTVLGRTDAWNFQQGSMLQWLGPDYNARVAFNDRQDGQFVTRIHDLETGTRRTIDAPVYTVSPDGTTALTLDFERLERMRPGYGYALPDSVTDTELRSIPENDGIYRLDLESGDQELLVSFSELCSFRHLDSMAGGDHWVNHLMFGPNGERVAFLHRWTVEHGGFHTRLLTIDPDSGDVECVTDSGRAPHFTWRSPTEILAWSRQQDTITDASKSGVFDNPILKLALSAVRAIEIPSWIRQNVIGDRFYLFDLDSGEITDVAPGTIDRDGHPSVTRNGRWAIFDTYPTDDGVRELFLYDFDTESRIDLGTFDSPTEFVRTARRCDLHPRWNRAGTSVCIDSMHEGTRRVYEIDVGDVVDD